MIDKARRAKHVSNIVLIKFVLKRSENKKFLQNTKYIILFFSISISISISNKISFWFLYYIRFGDSDEYHRWSDVQRK